MIDKALLCAGLFALSAALTTGFVMQQQQQPDAATSQHRMDEMNRRGNQAMGFDQMKTTHHFILTKDGGAIRVEANDAKDTQSRDQIRMHLHHIAMMFGEGNFETPMLVHGETPAGVDTMRRLKADIKYQYQETERGALVGISTANTEALDAVHDFLRYQIKEHKTGDSLVVTKDVN
jgi:hypothetical protein